MNGKCLFLSLNLRKKFLQWYCFYAVSSDIVLLIAITNEDKIDFAVSPCSMLLIRQCVTHFSNSFYKSLEDISLIFNAFKRIASSYSTTFFFSFFMLLHAIFLFMLDIRHVCFDIKKNCRIFFFTSYTLSIHINSLMENGKRKTFFFLKCYTQNHYNKRVLQKCSFL